MHLPIVSLVNPYFHFLQLESCGIMKRKTSCSDVHLAVQMEAAAAVASTAVITPTTAAVTPASRIKTVARKPAGMHLFRACDSRQGTHHRATNSLLLYSSDTSWPERNECDRLELGSTSHLSSGHLQVLKPGINTF